MSVQASEDERIPSDSDWSAGVRSKEEEERVAFEKIREFAHQRLGAAVDEIFDFFQRTVSDYENSLEKYQRLLDGLLKPDIQLHRLDGTVNGENEEMSSSEEEENEDDEGDDDEEDDEEDDDDDEDDVNDEDMEPSGDEDDEVGDEDADESEEEEEDESELDEEEVQEVEAFQPELSLTGVKKDKRKPSLEAHDLGPKMKKAKSEPIELLSSLKLRMTRVDVDHLIMERSPSKKSIYMSVHV